MKQIRVERKMRPPREDRYVVLPLDPRDLDVWRAKHGGEGARRPGAWGGGR
jgi:hypothetical protein